MAAGRAYPALRDYEVDTAAGDRIVVDLRYRMCAPYVLYGEIPNDQGVDRLMRLAVRPGDVCVDVGANIGYYTRLLSRLVGPTGRVVAYEPYPPAFDLLRRNSARLPNVRIVQAALSDAPGEADLFVARTEDMSSLSASAGRSHVRVRLETLDALHTEVPRVDFIKIDVEGFEYAVLGGGLELLRLYRPIVTFELTRRYIDRFGHDIEDFRALLQPLGYSIHWLDHHGVGASLLTTTRSNDAVAVPEERMSTFM